jgi:uncharacterized protein YecT (DUF1311 family)
MTLAPKLRLHLFASLAFLLIVAPCLAQHMNEKDSPCTGPATTVGLVDCLSRSNALSDTQLNSVYQIIQKRLAPDDARRLVETQRLWIKYRDANCSAERALYDGGTAAYPAYLGCLEAMTRARTKDLQVTYTVKLK